MNLTKEPYNLSIYQIYYYFLPRSSMSHHTHRTSDSPPQTSQSLYIKQKKTSNKKNPQNNTYHTINCLQMSKVRAVYCSYLRWVDDQCMMGSVQRDSHYEKLSGFLVTWPTFHQLQPFRKKFGSGQWEIDIYTSRSILGQWFSLKYPSPNSKKKKKKNFAQQKKNPSQKLTGISETWLNE